jgi:hypothetical protein
MKSIYSFIFDEGQDFRISILTDSQREADEALQTMLKLCPADGHWGRILEPLRNIDSWSLDRVWDGGSLYSEATFRNQVGKDVWVTDLCEWVPTRFIYYFEMHPGGESCATCRNLHPSGGTAQLLVCGGNVRKCPAAAGLTAEDAEFYRCPGWGRKQKNDQ